MAKAWHGSPPRRNPPQTCEACKPSVGLGIALTTLDTDCGAPASFKQSPNPTESHLVFTSRGRARDVKAQTPGLSPAWQLSQVFGVQAEFRAFRALRVVLGTAVPADLKKVGVLRRRPDRAWRCLQSQIGVARGPGLRLCRTRRRRCSL